MDSDRTRKDNGKAEFKFDDINYLSEMIEKMGSFIGTAANDFSEIASNVSDILEEIGINITEDEESKINQLVIQLSKEGEIIKRHTTLKEASIELGIHICCIINVCKGKCQTSMGYKWRYADE